MTTNKPVIPFGKYKGEDLEEFFFDLALVSKRPYYIKWLLDNNIIQGKFERDFLLALARRDLSLFEYKKQIANLIEAYRDYKRDKAKEYRNTNCSKRYSSNYEDAFYGHGTDYPEYY